MLTKNDLQQIKDLLDVQRTDILIETRVIVKNEIYLALRSVNEKLLKLEEKVDRLFEMETEDIEAMGIDIAKLKERVFKLEKRYKQCKLSSSKK